MNVQEVEAAIRYWVEAQSPPGTVQTVDMADADEQADLAGYIDRVMRSVVPVPVYDSYGSRYSLDRSM